MNLFEKLNRLDDSLVESKRVVKNNKLTESVENVDRRQEFLKSFFTKWEIIDLAEAHTDFTGRTYKEAFDYVLNNWDNFYFEDDYEAFCEDEYDDDVDEMLTEDLEYEFKPTELQKARAEVFKLNAMQRFKQDETLPEIFALYKELASADPEGKTSPTSGLHTPAEDFLDFYKTFQELKADREIEVDHRWDDKEKRDLITGAATVKFKSQRAKDKLFSDNTN